MEKIILGMLMLRGMTIYDMKVMITKKLDSMCSSSAGSIHSAVDKLLKQDMICCSEQGTKKIYYITESGRDAFNEWVSQPMTHAKAKDIELSKFFFLGAGNPARRVEMIMKYIEELKTELAGLEQIKLLTERSEKEVIEASMNMIKDDPWNEEGIKKNLFDREFDQTIADIYQAQMATLKFGIDSLQFEITWYETYLAKNQSK